MGWQPERCSALHAAGLSRFPRGLVEKAAWPERLPNLALALQKKGSLVVERDQ